MQRAIRRLLFQPFQRFFRLQSASGLLLLLATLIALLWANSPARDSYDAWWKTSLGFHFGPMGFSEPLHFWINEGLMALFFLVVGLEIKRELRMGELSSPRKAVLPLMAALGGMIVPAALYGLAIAWLYPALQAGWGIPTVTDIAFALGVLALLGARTPLGLKVFLAALAIIDDLGAIVLISVFYARGLHLLYLALAGCVLMGLALLNRLGARKPVPYLLLGLLLWGFMLHSGVHASIAGVLLALFIPVGLRVQSSLQRLEHDLHPWVSYGVLPLFALANAGVSLPAGQATAWLVSPAALGVVLGLFIGKQAGIALFAWLSVRLGWAVLPEGVTWPAIYGAAILGGIGFTMSLLIAALAFDAPVLVAQARLGVLLASLLSGVAGSVVLWRVLPPAPPKSAQKRT